MIPLEKSPEILAERADSILKKVGHTGTPADSDYGFGENITAYSAYAAAENSPQSWERVRSGQPAVIYFWHRTSPRYLEPLGSELVSPTDPASDVAGMTTVILDPRGRLLEFQIVPPQVKDETAPAGGADWTAIFAEASLDIQNFRPGESSWTPPVFADSTATWEGVHVDHPDVPVRIETAAYRGAPVYFQTVAPWDKPLRQEETFTTAARRASGIILILAIMCVVLAGVFLARRNLRQGRSDTSGAFKIALFVFIVFTAAGLLTADHIPDFLREMAILVKMAGISLFFAAVVGLLYLALEPYVRRRWANLIISWNRLLAGDFKDPLVGRDILVGGIFGLAHTAVIYAMPVGRWWMGLSVEPSAGFDVFYLQGFRHVWANFLAAPATGIFLAFVPLLLLILLVTILKKQWLATMVLWAIYFLILGLAFASGGSWMTWMWTGTIALLAVVCVSRFGLLAMVSFNFFFTLTMHNPISANVSSWYFGNTILAGVVLLGLAAFCFYTSLAKQPVFTGKLLPDAEN